MGIKRSGYSRPARDRRTISPARSVSTRYFNGHLLQPPHASPLAGWGLAHMAEPPYSLARRRLIEWLMQAARW
jgi:hypothetical protein